MFARTLVIEVRPIRLLAIFRINFTKGRKIDTENSRAFRAFSVRQFGMRAQTAENPAAFRAVFALQFGMRAQTAQNPAAFRAVFVGQLGMLAQTCRMRLKPARPRGGGRLRCA